jgi:2-polyprenyl-3-methyl-5-hydroxy-6-metoxy-1,4-benzoquinol methylase
MHYKFIPKKALNLDNISTNDLDLIESKAAFLYDLMQSKNWESFPEKDWLIEYFASRHLHNRLIYSIQNSVQLLLISKNECQKSFDNLKVLDYGAGYSTIFLLASLLGVKVYVNDIFMTFEKRINDLYQFLGLENDSTFIGGEADDIVKYYQKQNETLDVIMSRNVIEHIYDYEDHLNKIKQIPFDKQLIVLESTTANYANPMVFLQHKWLHYKVIGYHANERLKFIKTNFPYLSEKEVNFFVKKLTFLAKDDLVNEINHYLATNKFSKSKSFFYTNNCEPNHGIWRERLEPISFYKSIYTKLSISLKIDTGIWITNYNFFGFNILFNFINEIVRFVPSRLKIIFGPTLILIGKIK